MIPRFKMGMNSIFRTAGFCFVLFLSFSCSDPSGNKQEANIFNSEEYFSGEASRLASQVKMVTKVVGRNSEKDSGRVAVTDWKKELEPFSQCNISKPTFRNSYSVDSVSGSNTRRITYTALEPQLVIRSLEVNYAGDQIVNMQMVTAETNQLYTATRLLRYIPDSGYRISGRQEMTMGEKSDYFVEASWR
jgi:hypothetical protein